MTDTAAEPPRKPRDDELDHKCMPRNAVFSTALRTTLAFAYAEGTPGTTHADLHRRNGVDADQPHRIKYKAWVRG